MSERILRWQLLAFTAILTLDRPVLAGKVPLRPDELVAESKLIVVGQVESHRDEPQAHDDGSESKLVFLTVRVESVEKGADLVMPGDAIQAGLWVVVKEPRKGILWDAGHWGIPGDGGRARFFLESRAGETWNVIYPNGFERLDDTPALEYPMAPADRSNGLPVPVLGISGLVVFAAFVGWLSRRRYRRGGVR